MNSKGAQRICMTSKALPPVSGPFTLVSFVTVHMVEGSWRLPYGFSAVVLTHQYPGVCAILLCITFLNFLFYNMLDKLYSSYDFHIWIINEVLL